jgi:hypothetical protein
MNVRQCPGVVAVVGASRRGCRPGDDAPGLAARHRTQPEHARSWLHTAFADGTGSVRGIGTARPQSAARSRRARMAGLVAALAAAAAAAVGVLLGGSGPAAPGRPAALMLSGMNPATHIRVTAMTPRSWGDQHPAHHPWHSAECALPAGCPVTCGRYRDGRSVGRLARGAITVPASAGWRLSDIASLQLMAGASRLVTIRTARPASVRVRP